MGKKNAQRKKKLCSNPPLKPDIVTCKTSEVFGRYLEATEEIKKGTLILSEKCLIAGPLRSADPVCLGCHTGIDIQDPNTPRCSSCLWPVCSKACSESSVYHKLECEFFVDKKIKAPKTADFDFGLIAVLRGLLLKINNPSGWENLMRLEHHNELRKTLPLWMENQRNVVAVICDYWELSNLFSVEEVHTVCGILEVNGFEMGDKYSFRGIFPDSAMIAHNCTPNATQFENSEEGIIEIRAAVDIPSGSPIYLSYAYSLQSTPLRRKMLLDTKFFHCVCRRCMDPTELGSHLNTLKCQICNTGFLLDLGASNGDEEIRTCSNCQTKVEVSDTLLKFGVESQNLSISIDAQEKFLQKCLPFFHPTHFIPFGVKFNLCQAYGREIVNLINLPQKDLERKSSLCSEVLNVLDIICPGYNVTRGLVLYELQAAELMLARRIFESGKFRKSILKRKLENSLYILMESITILQFSHPETDEYKMAQAASEDSLPGLKQWISTLK